MAQPGVVARANVGRHAAVVVGAGKVTGVAVVPIITSVSVTIKISSLLCKYVDWEGGTVKTKVRQGRVVGASVVSDVVDAVPSQGCFTCAVAVVAR